MKEEWKNNKKIILRGLGILLILSLIVGISYAYWIITKKQEGLNKVSSGCFNIELSNEKNDIKLENAYPITDDEGRKLVPYSFTVTNTCSLFASYNINLEMLQGTTLASKYIKVMVNNEEIKNLADLETTNIVLNNSVESRKLTSGSLGSGDSEDYTVRIWMDGNITVEDKEAMNKVMLSKVVVDASVSKYNPVDSGITLLRDAILANEYQTTNVEEAKNRIANKQAVDFSKTAPIINWEESHANTTTTITVTLPDPSLVGFGIAGTELLTAQNVLPLIATEYTFNSETGKYTLTNPQNVDPTTLNYKDDNYYYCNTFIQTGSDGNIRIGNELSCPILKKIISSSKENAKDAIATSTKELLDGIKYKMITYEYTQSEVESDKSDKGIYTINDDYGTSYYYRGSVNNNYVLFGGHYWRIIRINGDGSIRLLYAGAKSNATGADLNVGTSSFNTKEDNPAYVGYMYGNTLNSSYAETHANEVDSTIKKYLDSWYRQNIEEKGLSSFIADSGFCNDRSVSSDTAGDGVSPTFFTSFNARIRLRDRKPSLMCSNMNDLFTVDNKGNKALTYPIGLMTSDELILSGDVWREINTLSYTYSSVAFWTLSPSCFWEDGNIPQIFIKNNAINVGTGVPYISGVRPVINLKADTEISGGIGTSNEPFIVK